VVSEISESSISMIRPIKESIPNLSQSAHARVDRNRKTTDFTYLTHLLCCPQVVRSAGLKKIGSHLGLGLSRQRWNWAGAKQAGGMVIYARARVFERGGAPTLVAAGWRKFFPSRST